MLFGSAAIESPSNTVVFSGEGGNISMEIDDYERLGSPDFHDANWLSASISVVAGGFGGKFAISIGTYELVELHRQLRRGLETLSGAVSFENMEGDLVLTVEFLNRGRIRITGQACPHASPSGRLMFDFESDQSYIGQTLEQLSGLLRRFPVKK